MAGKIIVIEGLDGSGKATQTDLLYKSYYQKERMLRNLLFLVMIATAQHW